MRLLGAVLAGGASRRFGSDKAMADWRGRPLIDHVVAALRPHVTDVVICGRSLPDLIGVPDRPAPGLGPLGGIAGALAYAAAHGYDAVLTAPCDAPAVDDAAFRQLLADGGPACFAQLPVLGLWPTTLGPRLEQWLESTATRAVRRWAAAIGATLLAFPGDAPPANVNYPADLAALDP